MMDQCNDTATVRRKSIPKNVKTCRIMIVSYRTNHRQLIPESIHINTWRRTSQMQEPYTVRKETRMICWKWISPIASDFYVHLVSFEIHHCNHDKLSYQNHLTCCLSDDAQLNCFWRTPLQSCAECLLICFWIRFRKSTANWVSVAHHTIFAVSPSSPPVQYHIRSPNRPKASESCRCNQSTSWVHHQGGQWETYLETNIPVVHVHIKSTMNSRYTSWLCTSYFRSVKRNLSNIRNECCFQNKIEDWPKTSQHSSSYSNSQFQLPIHWWGVGLGPDFAMK